jgi:serine/threonine-protein kinase
MVMELLDGQDLATILEQRGKYTVPDACDAIIDACDALAEAHGRGMVHRDLKPANLFAARGADGRIRIKVLDFGVSKVAAQIRQVALTSTGTALGTPHYMAPEQLKSAKGADARADIWSLGVVLYELLAGTQPFDGKSFGHLFMQIVSEDGTPLAKYRPDVPAGISEIVVKCMKKNRDERYPDLGAFVAALAPFASPSGQAQAATIARTRGGPIVPESARNMEAAAAPPKPNLARTAFMATPPAKATGSSPGFVPQQPQQQQQHQLQQQRLSQPMQHMAASSGHMPVAPVASSGHMPVAPAHMGSSPGFNAAMDPSGRVPMPPPQQHQPAPKKLSIGALVAIIAVFALMLIVGVVGIFAARARHAPH